MNVGWFKKWGEIAHHLGVFLGLGVERLGPISLVKSAV